jgi:hypothetical protein
MAWPAGAVPEPEGPVGQLDVARELSAATCSDAEASDALVEHRARVLDAPNLAEARRRALEPAETARGALSRARWLAPFSDDLRDAERRLERYASAVREADSREAVAAELDGLVQVAGGVDVDVGDGGCHYSGREVLAILLGFILGIIPGIILLILLC